MEGNQKVSANLEIAVVKSVRDLGIPAHIKGYFYLVDAVKIAVADKLAIINMTQSIYAPIADMYNTTAQRVGRAITRAIEIGWDRADLDTLQSYFGYAARFTNGYPSNAECIAVVAENVRLGAISAETTPQEQTADDTVTTAVTKVLQVLAVPRHIKGYLYLHEALCRCVEDIDLVNALNKVLYPVVAKVFETTPLRVERAMHHAIDMTWDGGNMDALQRIFGCTVSNTRGKPTVAEFLALIADDIRRRIIM